MAKLPHTTYNGHVLNHLEVFIHLLHRLGVIDKTTQDKTFERTKSAWRFR